MASGSLLLAGVPKAHGRFDGQTVTADWRWPVFEKVIESHVVVVGDGVELPDDVIIHGITFDIDIGDDFVLFLFNRSKEFLDADFNGWRFSDTFGTIPEIVGFRIDVISAGVSGLQSSDLFFDADSVWANFAGVTIPSTGGFIRLQVQFAAVVGDLDGDGDVGIVDFLLLLQAWGPCPDPCPPSCPADLDGDCNVGIVDFLFLLANWG